MNRRATRGKEAVTNPKTYIGTMGWSYDFWIGNFYPAGTGKESLLEEYSKNFNTVEVNSTFYRIPSTQTLKRWHDQTPTDFVFTVKFPKGITHVKKPSKSSDKLAYFMKRVSTLSEKLGLLLLQFPLGYKRDEYLNLKDLLEQLPDNHRYAIEFRNKSWLEEKTYGLLGDKGIAVVQVDPTQMPDPEVETSPFKYIRWLGDRRHINGSLGKVERDRREELNEWAQRIEGYQKKGYQVYGYFSKHYSGHPPTDVKQLKANLSPPPSLIRE
jgi:uncharacterized protein YecE (DUF72 family)